MPASNLRETELQLLVTSQEAELARLSVRIRKLSEQSAIDQAATQRHAQSVKRLFSAMRAQLKRDRQDATFLLAQSRTATDGTLRLVTEKLLRTVQLESEKAARLEEQLSVERAANSALRQEREKEKEKEAESRGRDEKEEDMLQKQVDALNQRLVDARLLVVSLLASHEEELKAAEKLAHVRDLARVARLRELEVNNDGLSSELKFARDHLQVLGFCCSSAESALSEFSPDMATKLSRSRAKRMDVIEANTSERRSELDQRSKEVLSIGGQQLVKAIAKSAAKAKEKRDATVELAAQLGAVLALPQKILEGKSS